MDEQQQGPLGEAKDLIRRFQESLRGGFSAEEDSERRELSALVDASRRLTADALAALTHDECRDLTKVLAPVVGRLDRIRHDEERKSTEGEPAPVNTGISVSRIRDLCETAFPIVSGCAARAGIRRSMKRMESEVAEHKGQLEALKETQAQRSAAQQSNFFGKEAEKYDAAASKWGWMVLAATAIFVFCAIAVWRASVPEDVAGGFALALTLGNRALLFVALGYGVFFCAKNYMANRHNAVVNRHRQNALETYLAVANAVKDQKHRDTVLAYAAQCIYVPQDSGFARRNSGSEISADTVIRLARGKMEE